MQTNGKRICARWVTPPNCCMPAVRRVQVTTAAGTTNEHFKPILCYNPSIPLPTEVPAGAELERFVSQGGAHLQPPVELPYDPTGSPTIYRQGETWNEREGALPPSATGCGWNARALRGELWL